jgi:hypothetical protein
MQQVGATMLVLTLSLTAHSFPGTWKSVLSSRQSGTPKAKYQVLLVQAHSFRQPTTVTLGYERTRMLNILWHRRNTCHKTDRHHRLSLLNGRRKGLEISLL